MSGKVGVCAILCKASDYYNERQNCGLKLLSSTLLLISFNLSAKFCNRSIYISIYFLYIFFIFSLYFLYIFFIFSLYFLYIFFIFSLYFLYIKCVCVCVWDRERECVWLYVWGTSYREIQRDGKIVCVCVSERDNVCEWER